MKFNIRNFLSVRSISGYMKRKKRRFLLHKEEKQAIKDLKKRVKQLEKDGKMQ